MVKLLKTIIFKGYVILLMIFTVWYGHFMFPLVFGFEGKEQAEISFKEMGEDVTDKERMFASMLSDHTKKSRIDLDYRVIEQPYIEGRFHHIGFEMEQDNASNCVLCHGNVPHDQSKEVRSFLNMHAFYTACETCHIRPKDSETKIVFRWYDKETGERTENPVALVEIEKSYRDIKGATYPTYGNYGAKIAPGTIEGDGFRFLHDNADKEFVERYLKEERVLTQKQKSQMKKLVHAGINEKPIECNQCHQEKNPYVPFAELGYPPRRVDELTNTSVVGMIDKYKEFYIPNFLTPGED